MAQDFQKNSLNLRVYRGYIGIMEKNGKENGNYYNGLYRGSIGIMVYIL